MVDLKAQPFNLDDEGVAWVEQTIAAMTDEEKIGQLFVNMGAERTEEYLTGVLDTYHIGAVRYQPSKAEEVWEQNYILQAKSKIPMLIAANTEAGGNGACTDGTYVGWEAKVAATGDVRYAYELGRISGIEASAVGCNWSFAPIVDIYRNWRNPIVSRRTWGEDADLVLEMSLAYMKGIQESGIAPAAKHWPGDGIDERDQHLSQAPNWLSTDEWDATFGKLYKGLFDAGLPSLMTGHIALPSYQKHFNPDMRDEDILPATISKEINTKLLREKLGFNGVVVTDASHMVGLTGAGKRSDLLPMAIEAGCDLWLFFNDPDEDFHWMMEGWKSGKLSDKRLHEALTRILGLKAMLGLHKRERTELLPPKEEALARIGLPEHQKVAEEVADKAIALVKNKQPENLPISTEKYPRVLVVPVGAAPSPFAMMAEGAAGHPADKFVEQLNARGYKATRYESQLDKVRGKSPEEVRQILGDAYSGKSPISDLTDNYDLVISVANITGLGQAIERPYWPGTKGTLDMPWYVHEIPTILVSTASPNVLPDMGQVKTYISAFDDKDFNIEILLDKLEGKSEFVGKPANEMFVFPDTRI
ncbi:glycoside hydrolase family 3 protein [Tessaracoccus oleiagri]|uniref:beta-N-acetylhexosaminidase n=1 Tax=Tessaracoccus oleiagri TaxID=686624 RepID=A0A1G9ICE7_9ACTN|nr:glycoside hydrolase family 3 N-terminal domain-containing protein [Tessaracoccus oleiagri]SDL22503.1 beta-N-acetylhexosaminidase [Tessaracoccus oleiagri]